MLLWRGDETVQILNKAKGIDLASIAFRADELAAVSGGRLFVGSPDTTLCRFAVDSRSVVSGDVFVAIRGDRFDGHRFVDDAFEAGAIGAIVRDTTAIREVGDQRIGIVVDDAISALQRIAQAVRRRSKARVVAITGSVGKTTTKELTATLLSKKYRVFRNEGNLNNHIGLPLSLLELHCCPEVAVVELGMNHAGEISELVKIAEPDVRVWTNVAEVHSASFNSIEEIADAKAEILEGATADSELVVNASDHRVMNRIAGFSGRVTTFGVKADADVRASDLVDSGIDGITASIQVFEERFKLRTKLIGEGNIANILAALCVAIRFNVPLEKLIETVEVFSAQKRRGEVSKLSRGVTVVDDSYNSNPTALRSMLRSVGVDTFHTRHVAVLGEMLELGNRSLSLHRECGRAVAEAGFTHCVSVGGTEAKALSDGALAAGLPVASVSTFETSDRASEAVLEMVRPGDLILVKGSRATRTDRIVDCLKEEWA